MLLFNLIHNRSRGTHITNSGDVNNSRKHYFVTEALVRFLRIAQRRYGERFILITLKQTCRKST